MSMENTKLSQADYKQMQRTVRQGFKLLQQGRYEDAQKVSRDLMGKYIKEPLVLYFSSEIEMINDSAITALEYIDEAIIRDPRKPFLIIQRARILASLRRRNDACQAALEVKNIEPENINILKEVGIILRQCEDFIEAEKIFKKILELNPKEIGIYFDLAMVQLFLGKIEKAKKNINIILEAQPKNGRAIHLRSMLQKSSHENNNVSQLKKYLDEGRKDWQTNMYVYFSLAKEYEDIGEYERSFSCLSKGAKMRRKNLNYNTSSEQNNIKDIISHYTEEVMGRVNPGFEVEGPIFIVGMPRTGTTLVERILSNHSQIKSVGEISDFPMAMMEQIRKTMEENPNDNLSTLSSSLVMDFKELGQKYFSTAYPTDGGNKFFIDKLPFNYLYCGLIKKALPNAKIIHLVRDPMDSCYAIYKTLFNQVYFFSYDLDELGDYYIAYRQLMDHWHAVMPNTIIDVVYEDVVNDAEVQARRILEELGIAWEDSVLDFHTSSDASSTASAAQVRQPIYKSSIQKWRNYENQLVDLKNKFLKARLM